ncbi:MAG: sigma-E processing peptidase SpoIIGA, partial [Clostridia bacterium]|nr:sigma-E processing peptidase SpoIIGA [Clostridia bacterium]
MVIYADIIFFINTISAYIMLYILGKVINNFRIRKKRILLSSLFGGLTATVIFCVD